MGEHEKPAIRVKGLTKTFRLPHERYSGLKQKILSAGKGGKGYEVQKVLDDVSFEIVKGEFFGIVGKNGSGKSTLLKTIAGIYAPDKGKVTIDGKLVPFIELGVGFNPELTGRENVFLNGALLGFSRKEMEAMYDEIVEFAELERFMDQKLKNYSSGMQVRLAFSIAIRAQGDILLLDEVLAVGDTAFQQKCFEYFAQLRRENKTVILVTHNMDSVERFCTRALMLDEGSIRLIGDTADVARSYEEANKGGGTNGNEEASFGAHTNDDVSVTIKATNQHNEVVSAFSNKDKVVLQLAVNTKQRLKNAYIGITIRKSDGKPVYNITTEKPNSNVQDFEADSTTNLRLELQNIFSGDTYYVQVAVRSIDRTSEYFVGYGMLSFKVASVGRNAWSLNPDYHMTVEAES